MTSAVGSITSVFTAILSWFAEALNTVGEVFYLDGNLTFIGTITVMGLGIAIVTMVIAMLRSLIKGRG